MHAMDGMLGNAMLLRLHLIVSMTISAALIAEKKNHLVTACPRELLNNTFSGESRSNLLVLRWELPRDSRRDNVLLPYCCVCLTTYLILNGLRWITRRRLRAHLIPLNDPGDNAGYRVKLMGQK